MHPHSSPTARFTLYLIFLAAISFIHLQIDRSQTFTLGMVYGISFFAYAWLTFVEKISWKPMLILGLLARFVLFPDLPSLSDDFYRFIWDGYLVASEVSPYLQIPNDIILSEVHGLTPELLASLNSQGTFSVYPPLNQLLYYLAVMISHDLLTQVNFLRFLAILADVISAYVLFQVLRSNKKHLAAAFFLNPLLILESTGNLHIEGLMIATILVSLVWLKRQQWLLSGGWMGLAVGIKLLPAFWVPFFLWNFRWKRSLLWGAGVFAIMAVTLGYLLVDHQYEGFMTSVDLYRRKFEFNASLYYLFREVGFWHKGYNIIGTLGPALAKVSLFLILIYSWLAARWKRPVPETLLLVWMIYLLLSSTIHPWYILPMIPLGLMAGYYFPVVWSLLIFVSYFGYTKSGYEPPYVWIVIEYTVVYAYAAYEIYRHFQKSADHH